MQSRILFLFSIMVFSYVEHKVNSRAKFCANIRNSKRVMGNKRNSKWRPLPSWIYYCCQFWFRSLLFPVVAGYTPEKFH